MVKIRLKQQGQKRQKSYRIVVVSSTVKRDGQTIEDIGFYNPIKNPSEINVNMEKYNSWLKKGAMPTNTVRAIIKNSTAKTA